jgi:hypothetical protein
MGAIALSRPGGGRGGRRTHGGHPAPAVGGRRADQPRPRPAGPGHREPELHRVGRGLRLFHPPGRLAAHHHLACVPGEVSRTPGAARAGVDRGPGGPHQRRRPAVCLAGRALPPCPRLAPRGIHVGRHRHHHLLLRHHRRAQGRDAEPPQPRLQRRGHQHGLPPAARRQPVRLPAALPLLRLHRGDLVPAAQRHGGQLPHQPAGRGQGHRTGPHPPVHGPVRHAHLPAGLPAQGRARGFRHPAPFGGGGGEAQAAAGPGLRGEVRHPPARGLRRDRALARGHAQPARRRDQRHLPGRHQGRQRRPGRARRGRAHRRSRHPSPCCRPASPA